MKIYIVTRTVDHAKQNVVVTADKNLAEKMAKAFSYMDSYSVEEHELFESPPETVPQVNPSGALCMDKLQIPSDWRTCRTCGTAYPPNASHSCMGSFASMRCNE